MLPRVLEPEVMDSAEEARDYDSMDHSAVNRAFAAEFLALWDTETPLLDLGTGTAQIPIELCRQCSSEPPPWGPLRWDSMHLVAIDAADHMLALARVNVEKAGLTDRIEVAKADAKKLPYPTAHFGAVISNSIIHHIPEPFACFAEMHRVCSPGANDHQRAMFAASLHAALTLDEVREMVGRLGYAWDRVQQTTDRHWTFIAHGAHHRNETPYVPLRG